MWKQLIQALKPKDGAMLSTSSWEQFPSKFISRLSGWCTSLPGVNLKLYALQPLLPRLSEHFPAHFPYVSAQKGPQEYWRVEISSHYWRDLNSQTLIPTKEKIPCWDTIFCALSAIIFAFWLLQTFPGESFEIVREMWNGNFIFHEAWSIRTPPPLPPLLPLALYHPLASVSIVPT